MTDRPTRPFARPSAVPLHVPFSPPLHSVARRASAVVLLVVSPLGCSRDQGAVATARAEGRQAAPRVASPPDVVLPGIAPSPTPYVVEAVTNGGTLTGMVRVEGALPSDSTIRPPDEIARTCGGPFVDRTVEADGPNVRGVVVWLEGARRGKALPVERRYEVTLDHCRLAPRTQPMLAGGTVQVHARDALRSLVRIVEWPGGTLRATITTNNEGQVVPEDRAVAEPGAYEVRGAQPAWLRAWLLAFDHPYFTTTIAGGAYAITEIPPGTYTVVAWHERFGRVEAPVTIGAGQATTVTLTLPAPNGSPGVSPNGAPDTASGVRHP